METFIDTKGNTHQFPDGWTPDQMMAAIAADDPTAIQTTGQRAVGAIKAAPQATKQAVGETVGGVVQGLPGDLESAKTAISDQLLPFLGDIGERTSLSIADTLGSASGLEAQERELLGVQGPRMLSDSKAKPDRNVEAAVQVGGSLVNATGETMAPVVEPVITAGLKSANWITGGMIPKAFRKFASTKVGQDAISIWNETGQKGLDYVTKTDPQTGKTLGALVNLLAVTTGGGRIGLPRPSDIVGLGSKGSDVATAARTTSMERQLWPEDLVGDGSLGVPKENMFLQGYLDPSPKLTAMAEEAQKTEGVRPKWGSARRNQQKLREAAFEEAETLDKTIMVLGNPKLDRATITQRIEDARNVIENQNPSDWVTINGNSEARTWADAIVTQFLRRVKDSDDSALSYLQIRRDIDQWANNMTNKGGWNPALNSGRRVAQTTIRNILNDEVNKAIPNDIVKKSLGKQHKLWSAYDILIEKSKSEGKGFLARRAEDVSKGLHVGPIGGMAIAGALSGAAGLTIGPTLATVIAGAGIGLPAWEAMKWAARRPLLNKALKETTKAMRKAEGAVLDDLKAERLTLIQMLQEETAPQEQQEQE